MPADRSMGFAGLVFDALDMEETRTWLAARSASDAFCYVVTPNVDHVVKIDRDPTLAPLYQSAALCLCDSRVLSRIARLFGTALPVVPGSDVVKQLFDVVMRAGDSVCIIGSDERAVEQLAASYPHLTLLHHAAPMGLRHDPAARKETAAAAARLQCRYTLLAVGCPQQELIAYELLQMGGATGTGLCIGASIDFMVGRQRRAPKWVQRIGFEWAWRLAGDPTRLARRYLWDGPRILPIVLRSQRLKR